MEKIILKPITKELIYKNGESDVHFDVLSYQGTTNQEKNLGSLFVIGQIKYSNQEDLSYIVSLISSLAKREYYSDISLQERNSKNSFERTLKKLNDVLDDFFKNKKFKLNIGLFVIANDNIFISRLGKFKVAMARNNDYIDVLNNIELFSKDAEDEKQFANIISGRLQPKDKIFAYFPMRAITSREKLLNGIFVKESQEEFGQKIEQLSANANNFSCCGIHIDMCQIKELPVGAAPSYSMLASYQVAPDPKTLTPDSDIADPQEEQQIHAQEPEEVITSPATGKAASGPTGWANKNTNTIDSGLDQSRIITAELSVSRRSNIITLAASQFRKIGSLSRMSSRTKLKGFIILALIIILPLIAFVVIKSGGSSQTNAAYNQASQNLKLAQSRIAENNPKEARSLLWTASSEISGLSGKKITTLKAAIDKVADGINHVSDKQPVLFADLSKQKDFASNLIAASGNGAVVISADGRILSANPDVNEIGQFKNNPKFAYTDDASISTFNGSDGFSVYDLKSKNTKPYSLKEPLPAAGAVFYENNFYTLSNNNIYKYADVTSGGVKRVLWGTDTANGQLISIAADGNIFTLNSDGQLIKYFKGKQSGAFDLQVKLSSDSRIFTSKNAAFIYLSDKPAKLVYVFDKTDGSLKATYKLGSAKEIKDINISSDGTIWILSGDNKVWQIK